VDRIARQLIIILSSLDNHELPIVRAEHDDLFGIAEDSTIGFVGHGSDDPWQSELRVPTAKLTVTVETITSQFPAIPTHRPAWRSG
jgi:hypothetical protein